MIAKPVLDDRWDSNQVSSRIGLKKQAVLLPTNVTNLSDSIVEAFIEKLKDGGYLLVDEVQFLDPKWIRVFCYLVDKHNINVYCYGLRSLVNGTLAPAVTELFVFADKVIQLPNLAKDGKPAIMHLRKNDLGYIHPLGSPGIAVGGDEMYESVSRETWFKELGYYLE